MTAPLPGPASRNRITLWTLIGIIAALALSTFLLVSFYFPKRRVRAPEELREKLKPRIHGPGAVELTPASGAAPVNSAPASAPATSGAGP